MFRAALIKLTFIYLMIIMAISLFFSLTIYGVATQEITNNLGRQQNAFERFGHGGPMIQNQDFIAEQARLAMDSRQNIINYLLYTNVAILVLGGGLSYFLAGRSLKPIMESHDAQSRFTSDASHELRSPLAAMKTEIEVALRDPKITKEEAISLLTSNLEEVERLRSLSDGLLSLARDGGESLQRKTYNLSELINKSAQLVAKSPKQKKIDISTDLDDKINIFVDETSIRELFVLLLDNAIKYSKPGKNIAIHTSEKNKFAIIKIIDEGIGMSSEDQKKVFERFYRVDQSRTKNKIPGYGLGLALAKKITETNHGSISVVSKFGEGSTFTVRLPISHF